MGGWCEDHFREGLGGSNPRLLLQTRATANVIVLFAGTVFSTAYTVTPNVNHVYAAVYNGASSQIYADGTLLATGNTGSLGTNIFLYFADTSGVSREGALYRAVEINRVLTAQELADVQAWCAAATGVTLS